MDPDVRRSPASTDRGWPILVAASCGALVTASAYWPGLMSWDPVRQYGEALSGAITDWHPPAMQWLWRRLIAIDHGPAPMLVLQLALYWGGFAVLAQAIRARGGHRLGWGVMACGLLPLGLALTGMILKDCLMAGALLMATGLLAWYQQGGRRITAVAGIALLVMAATLRFNAFLACAPLLVALIPAAWRATRWRLALTGILATVALIAAMPIANRLIRAAPSNVGLSLVIFDLGGITEHSRVDVFPEELEVANAVAANHRCYRPAKWDSYSDWVDPECPLGFTAWTDNVDPAAGSPYAIWVRAILAHPVAYAAHRLVHVAFNTRVLPLADAVERPVPATGAPNPWGFRITPNAITRLLDALAMATAHTPLGWPIMWIGVALSALLASRGLANARLIVPIALSSLLYGSGYLVFSVASELRYHLWTELAALIAIVMVVADAGPRHLRRRLWAGTPTILALGAGIVGRLLLR